MLLWLAARSLWNSVTVGLASASFCRIASDLSVCDQASCLSPISSVRLAQVEAGLGQACERFGPGVAVGLEAISQGLEERQRLLQERLAERVERRVVLQLGVVRHRVAELLHGVDRLLFARSARLRCALASASDASAFVFSSTAIFR